VEELILLTPVSAVLHSRLAEIQYTIGLIASINCLGIYSTLFTRIDFMLVIIVTGDVENLISARKHYATSLSLQVRTY